jgi:hypothetical protein
MLENFASFLLWPAIISLPLVLTHNDLYKEVFPAAWYDETPRDFWNVPKGHYPSPCGLTLGILAVIVGQIFVNSTLPPPTPNFLASRTNPRSRQIVDATIGQVVVYQEVSISPWRNQRSFISGRVCIVVMQRYALKLVLVGDSRVGKSQLSRAFVNKSFLVS